MLLATYESLLECSIEKFKELHVNSSSLNFWDWLHSITSKNNKNEVSRFWAKILITLHLYCGFYFSIRSGNWVLRNSFLKALAPLFLHMVEGSTKLCLCLMCMTL